MANARPEITRPSAIVVLSLRLEEWDDTGQLKARLPPLAPGAAPASTPEAPTAPGPQPPGSVDAVVAQLAALDVTIAGTRDLVDQGFSDPALLDDLEAQRSDLTDQLGQLQANQDDPLEYTSAPSPDDRSIVVQFVPTSCSIERNDIRTADECSITMDFRDLPADARLVRGASVEVYVGVVDPQDFELGMRGLRRDPPAGADRGTLRSYVQANARNVTRFVGVVDRWGDSLTQTGDEITVECRDYTALPLDTPLATGAAAIDLTLPIDQGVQAFLRQYPTLVGVVVTWEGGGAAPVPASAAPQSTATRQRRGSTGTGSRGHTQHRRAGQNQNLWDMVTDACARCAVVPIFQDYAIRIVDPRTFWSSRSTALRVVYGQYLTDFGIDRRLGAIRVPTFEVDSYDPDIGRVRWARYPVPSGSDANASAGIYGQTNPPAHPTRPNEPTVAGWNPTERIRYITVQGVTDLDVLRRLARAAFEQVGRQELEGHFATDSVTSSSPDGAIDRADMLDLRAGDAVEILIAGSPGAPAAQVARMDAAELSAMEVSRRADYLVGIGWGRSIAQRFAKEMQALAGQTIFRVKGVTISWDTDTGIEVSVDFINYIELREDAQSTQDNGTPADPQPPATPDTPASVTEPLLQAQADLDIAIRQLQEGTITQQEYNDRASAIQERMVAAQQGNG